MKIISANAFLIILLITQNQLVPNFGIIGGEHADRYPFYVVVLRNDEPCGGSIIDSNTVATAATCVYCQDKLRWAFSSEIFVIRGDYSSQINWRTTRFYCNNYKVHPEYDHVLHGGNGLYNVAIITKQKFNFTDEPPRNEIIMCATEHLGDYSYAFVIGLGLIH